MPNNADPIWEEENNTPKDPHILIVEDQPNTAEMLSSYFEAQGYHAVSVGWGKDALDYVEKDLPDLIILDIQLPDITGYEVCEHLRSQRRTEHVPVIFLTKRKEKGDKLSGLELGAIDYISKPFDLQELRLRVRNVLQRSHMKHARDPITGLPTPALSEGRLSKLLECPNQTVIAIRLQGLKAFSESYGFVARDDVVRAVALVLSHTLQESQNPEAFVGHLDINDFLVIVTPEQSRQIQHLLTTRLEEAVSFFYPYTDWEVEQDSKETQPLNVTIRMLDLSDRRFNSVKELKQALFESQPI